MKLQTSCTKEKSKVRADRVFYQIGKGIWFPFLIAGFWFAGGGYAQFGENLRCDIRELFGVPCPGCGGTRAVYYLFRGNLAESFRLHAAVLYGVGAYLHFMILCFYRKNISKTWENKEIRLEYYLYAAIIVILVQWVIKIINILYLLQKYL